MMLERWRMKKRFHIEKEYDLRNPVCYSNKLKTIKVNHTNPRMSILIQPVVQSHQNVFNRGVITLDFIFRISLKSSTEDRSVE